MPCYGWTNATVQGDVQLMNKAINTGRLAHPCSGLYLASHREAGSSALQRRLYTLLRIESYELCAQK